MKVIGLDGRKYNWNFAKHSAQSHNPSQLHQDVKKFLRENFGTTIIFEEVFLPGSNGLRLDFYIPAFKIAIECQGEQHYIYNSYFHKEVIGFHKSILRDENKRKWCELNNILLIEIPYYLDQSKWSSLFQKG